jgi:peptide/nickel transport system permease protein
MTTSNSRNSIAEVSKVNIEPKKRLPFIVFLTRLFKEKPLGTFGGIIVLLLLIVSISANWLAPYGMNDIHPMDRLAAPSTQYLLGTDQLGRDILSRIIYGARISLYVGLGGSAICTIIATIIGLVSGYFGGKLDIIIQRFIDAFLCFPQLFFMLAVMALLGPGLIQVIVVLGVLNGIFYSRVVRGAVIAIRQNAYIDAARAIGSRPVHIIIKHILPNVAAPIIILFTVSSGYIILGEATLSFLGFGVPPPAPSWGGMLSGPGREYMFQAPWIALWPGLALTILVYGLNMFGDAVRDLLDPRLRGGVGSYRKALQRKGS